MPDWSKLASKGKEYSNKGLDRGKKAYNNSRSAPTDKSDPMRGPREPPAEEVAQGPTPAQMNRPVSGMRGVLYVLKVYRSDRILHRHHCVQIQADLALALGIQRHHVWNRRQGQCRAEGALMQRLEGECPRRRLHVHLPVVERHRRRIRDSQRVKTSHSTQGSHPTC